MAREETLQKLETAETIAPQVNASASPGAELPDALATDANRAFAEEMRRMIANVGTGLWRMRQKMLQPGTDEPFEEMRRVYRHFESVWDAIIQAGAEIQDHTDAIHESGTRLNVVAFEPTAGIEREVVKETLKPTIYFRGHLIQTGEVIVATYEN